MIKFIICEDNVDALERASQTVTKTMMKYDIEYKIYKFTKYDSKLKEQIKDEFNTKFYILDIELPIALEGTAGFNEITYSEYLEKMEEKVPFLVVIVKDGCGYCEMYEPILEEVAGEYNLPINYINLTNLTEEEYNDLSKSNSYLRTNQWGRPTTLFMYGTTVVDSIGGYVEKDNLVSFIETNFKVEKNEE